MLGFLFRTGTYYLLWQKFKKQIITIFISIGLIFLILGVYNDLFTVLKISNKENIIYLLLIKWFLIVFIVVFNIFMIKKINTKEIKQSIIDSQYKETEKKPLSQAEKNIMQKEELISLTDQILSKYSKNK